MSAPTVASARSIAWIRRRRAASAAWREYRRIRPGMVGLAILGLAVAMALAAPLLASSDGLHAVNTTQNPAWPPTHTATTTRTPALTRRPIPSG